MDESSMVERVATAMWAKKELLTPPPRVSWENAEAMDQTFMLEVARAAIEAMREPTAEMIRCLVGYEEDDSEKADGYRAAIDAALK